jgi:hypothetical protein
MPAVPVRMIIAPAGAVVETALAAGISAPVAVAANAVAGGSAANGFSSALFLLNLAATARSGAATDVSSFGTATAGAGRAAVAGWESVVKALLSRATLSLHATASAPKAPTAVRRPTV